MSTSKPKLVTNPAGRTRKGSWASKTGLPRISGASDGPADNDRRLPPPHDARIMIVDDEPTVIGVIQHYLKEEGYSNFVVTSDPERAMSIVLWERPDLILLDILMPRASALEILKAIRWDPEVTSIPVIMLSSGMDRVTRSEALRLGATDFLQKPVDPSELAARVGNNLIVKAYQKQLKDLSRTFEAAVCARTGELEASRRDVIRCVARAVEYRDNDTGHHVVHVGKYARIMGAELGFEEADLDVLEQAAQLHDVGKIGVPDEILLKADRLTPAEFEKMKEHCVYGNRILDGTGPWAEEQEPVAVGADHVDSGNSPSLKLAASIALTHHERWDGTGYPWRLAGEDIPIEGRIVAIADVFDAVSSKRPYKPALPREECFKIMEQGRSSHFDPRVLDAFLKHRDKVVQVQISYPDLD
jgi:putative two-component system response regulator